MFELCSEKDACLKILAFLMSRPYFLEFSHRKQQNTPLTFSPKGTLLYIIYLFKRNFNIIPQKIYKLNVDLLSLSLSSNFINENDDETPMRLSDINDIEETSSSTNHIYEPAENFQDKKASTTMKEHSVVSSAMATSRTNSNLEVKRSATIVRNPSLKSSSTSTIVTEPATTTTTSTATTNTLMFNSNSLPRSRTPTVALTNSDMTTSKSYRSTTMASSSSSNSNNNQHTSALSSTSTQYHPISNSLSNNIVKTTTLPKKKPVFY